MSDTFLIRDLGPAVEPMIVRDMLRRTWPAMPIVVVLGALAGGVPGGLSAGFGLGLAIVNFIASAAMLAWGARISIAMLMGIALGGYIMRLALITVAVLLVKDLSWARLVPMCMALLLSHLGLLVWEARFVSTSLAFPGLKPSPSKKGASS